MDICPHQRIRSKRKECGGGGHLPSPAHHEQAQGVRGGGHLPACKVGNMHMDMR